jgi:hypothetical protein
MKLVLKFLFITLIFFLLGCGQDKKQNKEKFFPVLSFIQSQVADIDTSLYSIRKVVFADSMRADTFYMHREDFRKEARDFLSVPDISLSKYQDRYVEDKMVDEMLNRVQLTYLPLTPEKEEIQRQEVLIKPDPSGDKVTNIIIHSVVNTKDSSVQKRLLWKIDESFQVSITKQLAGQPETTSTIKVIWNADE